MSSAFLGSFFHSILFLCIFKQENSNSNNSLRTLLYCASTRLHSDLLCSALAAFNGIYTHNLTFAMRVVVTAWRPSVHYLEFTVTFKCYHYPRCGYAAICIGKLLPCNVLFLFFFSFLLFICSDYLHSCFVLSWKQLVWCFFLHFLSKNNAVGGIITFLLSFKEFVALSVVVGVLFFYKFFMLPMLPWSFTTTLVILYNYHEYYHNDFLASSGSSCRQLIDMKDFGRFCISFLKNKLHLSF